MQPHRPMLFYFLFKRHFHIPACDIIFTANAVHFMQKRRTRHKHRQVRFRVNNGETPQKRMCTAVNGVRRKLQKTAATSEANAGGIILRILRLFASAAAAFIISGTEISGGLFPFGAAFAAGCPPEYLLSACIGSAAGSLVFCEPMQALKYTGASCVVFVLRAGLEKFISPRRRTVIYPLTAFASLLLCGTVTAVAADGELTAFFMTVCEAVITGTASCFICRTIEIVPSSFTASASAPADTVSVMFVAALFLLSLDRLVILDFSFAHLLAGLLIMTLSLLGKENAGAAAGILCGLAFGVREDMYFIAYPLAGLICGICSPYGKFACAAGFTVCSALALILRGNADTALVKIIEMLLSAAIFAALPKMPVSRFMKLFKPFSRDRYDDESRSLLGFRVKKSAKGIKDIAFSVDAVCKLLSRAALPEPDYIINNVRSTLCSGCTKLKFCWDGAGTITETAFRETLALCTAGKDIAPEILPERLRVCCSDKNGLCASFNREMCCYRARIVAKNESLSVKKAASAQLKCAARLLEDAAFSVTNSGRADARLTALMGDTLAEEGFECSFVTVNLDDCGRASADAFCTKIPRLRSYAALLEKLAQRLGIDFAPPVADEYKEDGTVLSFYEKTRLNAHACKVQRKCDGETLCGDSCEVFRDNRGNFCCVLSDGMGTGSRAALDSVMTSSLMARLMKSGFNEDTAFDAVNAALMVNSADETMATLDILRIDLNTGKTEFMKAGSSFSVVRRSGRTAIVERSSLPLGIIGGTRFERSETNLSAGDAVIIMSDGASYLSYDFFKNIFREKKNTDEKELAAYILEKAATASPGGKCDDITVCVVTLD